MFLKPELRQSSFLIYIYIDIFCICIYANICICNYFRKLPVLCLSCPPACCCPLLWCECCAACGGLESCLLDLLFPWWLALPKGLPIPPLNATNVPLPLAKPSVNVRSSCAASTRLMYFLGNNTHAGNGRSWSSRRARYPLPQEVCASRRVPGAGTWGAAWCSRRGWEQGTA